MDKGAIEPNNPKWQKDKNKPDAKTCKNYIQSIKHFLSQFKTKPCTNYNQHNHSLCYFHHQYDQRRNPYLQDTFLYYPKHQLPQYISERNQNTPLQCINETEFLYHPIMYKKQLANNFYKSPNSLLSSHLHPQQKKLLQYGEFFRFDINTHKTKLCPKREYHERKVCIYYHNDMDRRRPNFNQYSHEMCQKPNCQNKNCQYSHNKIQQVYHPSRFKSKFCQVYHNKQAKCEYKEFCAFAHSQQEIKVQMIHLLDRDQNFYNYKYKTVWCPNTEHHQRATCVYAHNIQDFRRNPIQYKYKPQKCPDWKFQDSIKSIQNSGCKKGMKCDKSHGWMESKYHPLKEKKGKQNLNQKTMEIIQKKLISQKNPKLKGISNVVQEKCLDVNKSTHHGVGIPFFKKQPNLSESSRKTRGITTNIQSDDSYAKQKQNVIQKQQQKQVETDVRKNNMFLFAQDHIWRNDQDENNEFERKLNQERARSENKFDDCETVYSHSLKETVGNSNILRKLKNNNINGVKIKNLSKQEISDFCFLNNNEKEILSHKVRLYHLKRQRNPILYSIQISKFFIRRKKQQILEKTQSKKIKEQQLLTLKVKQIQVFDFLTTQQKAELPFLLQQYKKFINQNQFNQINQQIFKFVSPKQQRIEK